MIVVDTAWPFCLMNVSGCLGSEEGWVSWLIAHRQRHVVMARCAVQHGAKLDYANNKNETAYMLVATHLHH